MRTNFLTSFVYNSEHCFVLTSTRAQLMPSRLFREFDSISGLLEKCCQSQIYVFVHFVCALFYTLVSLINLYYA